MEPRDDEKERPKELVWDDPTFAQWLKERSRKRETVLLKRDGSILRVERNDDDRQTQAVDPQTQSRRELKNLARKGCLLLLDGKRENPEAITEDGAADLVDKRQLALGRTVHGKKGRGKPINKTTARAVWTDACGRCMFEGCGKDLTHIDLSSKRANISYMAHIVASSPDGPRGDPVRSHKLSNEPGNIMLMCDEHHRLIDSYSVSEYDEERLLKMRRWHVDRAREYSRGFQYERVHAVKLRADLGVVPTIFRDGDILQALLDRKLTLAEGVSEYLRHDQREDRRRPEYWENYLHQHEPDIIRFRRDLQTMVQGKAQRVALFAIHHIPMLLLIGRILGEAMTVELFQYDRTRDSFRWNPEVQPRPEGFFNIHPPKNETPSEEILVSLELTDTLDLSTMPATIRKQVEEGDMPWYRIKAESPGIDAIQHPQDLQQFRRVARALVMRLQDRMGAQKIHLVAISPVTATVAYGQLLQAGHHADHIIYDRPNREEPFLPALRLTGVDVSAAGAENPKTIIQLR